MSSDDILPIVMCGDPVLRRPAEPVDPGDLATPYLRNLIARMRATMHAAPGVGLAAPQIGESLQLAVVEDGPERWGQLSQEDLAARDRTPLPFTVMVNPVLTALEDQPTAAFYEGCLSVPGLTGIVRRHRQVRIDALDEHAEPYSRRLSGWAARIAQHEIDHLLGVLYLDRVETRSLSTLENYQQHWARHYPADAAAALGFELTEPAPT